jgi:hypothetical protein
MVCRPIEMETAMYGEYTSFSVTLPPQQHHCPLVFKADAHSQSQIMIIWQQKSMYHLREGRDKGEGVKNMQMIIIWLCVCITRWKLGEG